MGSLDKTNGQVFCTKNIKWIDEPPASLEQYFKAATKLQCELAPGIEMEYVLFMELSSLAEDIHVRAREASHNTDLDMQEFLGINEALKLCSPYRLTW